MNTMSNFEAAKLGETQAFFHEGMKVLDQYVLLGEQEAKLGAMVAMASGLNVVLFGAPGGGKTTLGESMPRLVGDIKDSDVAVIPPQSDITSTMLTGGIIATTKTINIDGSKQEETVSTEVEGIIKPTSRVIWANEINRTNQYAFNTALEAFEKGVVDNSGGRIHLDIAWSASTMNPGEKRDGTFPITAAMASRHAIGASMGTGTPQTRSSVVSEVLAGWEPQLDKVDSITTTTDLKRMRALIESREEIGFPADQMALAGELVLQTTDVLREQRINETDNRLAKHIRKIAKTLAAFNAQNTVREEDVRQAVRFAAAARLGMLTSSQTVSDEILNNLAPIA